MQILILAGGGGTRLWPLSRQDFPKQFLRFNDPLSLLQKTVKRFLNASFATKIVVLTTLQHQKLVEQQLAKIDPYRVVQVLVEPVRKNTAPAIALGMKYLEEIKGSEKEEAVLVIPSDHLLEPESDFLRFLEEAELFAKRGRFILFGIQASRPETGYGYIQRGEKEEGPLYSVQRFVEKPNRLLAEEYFMRGDYFWNSGMFACSPQSFWEEIAKYIPAIHAAFQGTYEDCLRQFSQNPDISIDYAILEKTQRSAVYPLPISWSDVGCWDSIYEMMDKDENLNVKVGNVLEVNTKNSLIMGRKKLISTIGLEDLLIVDTEDVTFISKKGESQKVKELVDILLSTGRREMTLLQDCDVKQIYTSEEGINVFSYKLSPLASFSYVKPLNSRAYWVVLKGNVQINKDKLRAPSSYLCSEMQEQIIENMDKASAELLLIQSTAGT